MHVEITRIHAEARLPQYETLESSAFDLTSVAAVTVEPGKVALIPTGLVIKVPQRMFLGIFARSSTPLKRGLIVANGVGVIDPDYSGPNDEVMIQVMNVGDSDVKVSRGDRLAQGIVLPAPRVVWEEVSEIREVTRGGFGSTGTA